MEDFNLTWETFKFHTEQIKVLESEFLSEFKKVAELLDMKEKGLAKINFYGITPPNDLFRIKSTIEVADRLINSYAKQHDAIDELIEFNRYHSLHGIPLPEGKDASLHSLFGLKNSSQTLINVARKRKNEIVKLFS